MDGSEEKCGKSVLLKVMVAGGQAASGALSDYSII